ncbi:hypothetical protein Tco_1346296 [Tanacetum coccineum]
MVLRGRVRMVVAVVMVMIAVAWWWGAGCGDDDGGVVVFALAVEVATRGWWWLKMRRVAASGVVDRLEGYSRRSFDKGYKKLSSKVLLDQTSPCMSHRKPL